jgi:hypothetical protein
MIRAITLILVMFLFLTGCTDRNFYVAKLYNDTISIRIPVSWQIIELKNYNSEELIYNKFIGDSIKLEGLKLEVYGERNIRILTLDETVTNEIESQKVMNTETRIIDRDVKMINGNKAGIIRYTFGIGDGKVWFGETILIVKGNELYKMQLFSRSETVEAFQKKCAKITASVKINF